MDPALKVKITGDATDFNRALNRAQEKTRNASKKMAQAWGLMKQAIKTTAVAVSTVAVASAKMAKDFGKQMTEVSTLVNLTNEQLGDLSKQVLALSSQMGQSTKTMTKGLYDTLSASVELEESIGFLEIASKAAIGGVSDTATTVDVLTSVVNSYGDALGENLTKTQRAAVAWDVLFMTIKRGKTTMSELGADIGRVANTAALVGVGFDEVGASLALMTRKGIGTNEAVTALNQALLAVIKPATEAKETAQRLGIDFSAAAVKAKGLGKFFKDLYDVIGDDAEAIGSLFRNVRSFKTVATTLGAGIEELEGDLEAMTNAAGSGAEAYNKMSESMSHFYETSKQRIINFGILVGEHMLKPLVNYANRQKEANETLDTTKVVFKGVEQAVVYLAKAYFSLKAVILGLMSVYAEFAGYSSQMMTKVAKVTSKTWDEILLFVMEKWKKFIQQVEGSLSYLSEWLPGATQGSTALLNHMVDIQEKINERTEDMEASQRQYNDQLAETKAYWSEMSASLMDDAQQAQFDATYFGEMSQAARRVDEELKDIVDTQLESMAAAREQGDAERRLAFYAESRKRAMIEDTTKFIEGQLKKRTVTFAKSIDKQRDLLKSLKDQYEGIDKTQKQQRQSFAERLVSIQSSGLSERGKAIQQAGLARYFQEQAAASGDLEEQLRLQQKAQDIYGNLAEAGYTDAFQQFMELQGQIQRTYQQQKQANLSAQGRAQQKIQELSDDIATMFQQVEQTLEIKVDTQEAQEKMTDLAAAYERLQDSAVEGGYISRSRGNANAIQGNTEQGQTLVIESVNLEVTETVDRNFVREVLFPEIQKVSRKAFNFAAGGV